MSIQTPEPISIHRLLYSSLAILFFAVTGCQSSPHQSQMVGSVQPPAAAIPQGSAGPEQSEKPAPAQARQSIQPTVQNRPGAPAITAKAAILVDHRGRILFDKNSETRMPTASTQKLLLALVICESGNLYERITVSASDCACEPTKMGIKAGETYVKGDLLKAVLVRSSNDIARCLARHHSGSVSNFAQVMNARARQLGMHDSYFTNASGLPTPPGQYSTARDLVILARASMRHPAIREAVATKAMVFRFADGRTKTIYNTNQVLKGNPYCNGCKTGFTNAAGRCLVSSAAVGRRSVIAVVLGSKTPTVWQESDALLRYGLGF